MKLSELIAKLQELKDRPYLSHGPGFDADVIFEFGTEVDFHWDGDFVHIGSPEAIEELKNS